MVDDGDPQAVALERGGLRRRRRRGRAPARPWRAGRVVRGQHPGGPRRPAGRGQRRGRAAARRPRSGCRPGAAAAAGRWCSRRSCSRRRSGSGRRRGRRRGPGRGTARGRRRRGAAVVGLTRPKRFADGAATPSPVVASSALGQRVGRRPQPDGVAAAGDGVGHPSRPRGSSSVSGPGQHAAASTAAAGGTTAAQSRQPRRQRCGRSAGGRPAGP